MRLLMLLEYQFHYLNEQLHYYKKVLEFDYHYFGWNYEFLNAYLIEAGFKKNERVKKFDLFQKNYPNEYLLN